MLKPCPGRTHGPPRRGGPWRFEPDRPEIVMSRGIVELYTETGEVVPYRKLSRRLPEFLARYGPAEGYGTVTEIVDWLSLNPGLLRLYEIAIRAGHKPEEVGLPSLSSTSRTRVCRATLVDGAGRVLSSATATKVIVEYKDLEVLETAARQRLLAALGFGGEVLDDDEAQDRRDQSLPPITATPDGRGRATTPSSVAPVWSAGSTEPAPAVGRDDKEDGAAGTEATPRAEAAGEASSPADEAVAVEATPPPNERPDESPAADDRALALLRRQIAHLAKLRGAETPVVGTRDEAQVALKRLLQAMPS